MGLGILLKVVAEIGTWDPESSLLTRKTASKGDSIRKGRVVTIIPTVLGFPGPIQPNASLHCDPKRECEVGPHRAGPWEATVSGKQAPVPWEYRRSGRWGSQLLFLRFCDSVTHKEVTPQIQIYPSSLSQFPPEAPCALFPFTELLTVHNHTTPCCSPLPLECMPYVGGDGKTVRHRPLTAAQREWNQKQAI